MTSSDRDDLARLERLNALEHPPAGEVPWRAVRLRDKAETIVMARTWFAARLEASRALKCEAAEIQLERLP